VRTGRRTGGHTPAGASVLAALAGGGTGSGGKYRVAHPAGAWPPVRRPQHRGSRVPCGPGIARGVGDPQGRVSARHTT